MKAKIKLLSLLVLGGCTMTFLVCKSCLVSVERFILVGSYCSSIWISMWLGNEYLVNLLDKKILWTKEPIKRLIAGIVGMLAFTIPAAIIITKFFEFSFNLNVGDLSGIVYGTIITTSIITVFLTSRSFLFNWRQSAIDAEKLQKEGMAAKYESLKNQVNPHFLFNTLNALTNLVYEDQDKAAKFIKQLSEVYRYVLETREKELVSVQEESNFLKAYLFLQQIRFGNKLKLEVSLERVEGMVAPLVLQMLIENAIKHNIIAEERPLTVRVFREGEFITVQNNLQKKQVLNDESPGVGLENISRRYEFLTDRKLEIIQGDSFIVKLPLIPVMS